MSSNRAFVLAAMLSLVGTAGCAVHNPIDQTAIKTPTEQYQATVDSHVQGIQLAVHPGELSTAQTDALWGLVQDWRDSGAGQIRIDMPDDPMGGATLDRIEETLTRFGLRGDQYQVAGLPPGGPSVVRVSFMRYTADIPKCGQVFSDFTATAENAPESNFGCAVTANIAAMVANPADLAEAQPMDPPDAGRRQVVLDKYRAGDTTSSAKDDQADGSVSTVAKH